MRFYPYNSSHGSKKYFTKFNCPEHWLQKYIERFLLHKTTFNLLQVNILISVLKSYFVKKNFQRKVKYFHNTFLIVQIISKLNILNRLLTTLNNKVTKSLKNAVLNDRRFIVVFELNGKINFWTKFPK